jgi:hypothetical protein
MPPDGARRIPLGFVRVLSREHHRARNSCDLRMSQRQRILRSFLLASPLRSTNIPDPHAITLVEVSAMMHNSAANERQASANTDGGNWEDSSRRSV